MSQIVAPPPQWAPPSGRVHLTVTPLPARGPDRSHHPPPPQEGRWLLRADTLCQTTMGELGQNRQEHRDEKW